MGCAYFCNIYGIVIFIFILPYVLKGGSEFSCRVNVWVIFKGDYYYRHKNPKHEKSDEDQKDSQPGAKTHMKNETHKS